MSFPRTGGPGPRRAAIVLVGWGAWLGVATAVQAPFGPRTIEFVLLGAAALACLLVGGVLWLIDRRRARTSAELRLISDSSFATVTLCIGLAIALVGAGFGLWLILIGAGIAALGAGGLVRELRARRARRLALRGGSR